jgi:hypothetical protein
LSQGSERDGAGGAWGEGESSSDDETETAPADGGAAWNTTAGARASPCSSPMERAAADHLGARSVLSSLVRPLPACPTKMKSLVSCALTLKVDGVRMALLLSPARAEAHFAAETRVLRDGPFLPASESLCVIDCEYHSPSDTIFALDLLLYDGRDVRQRTLSERLALMVNRLPSNARAKPYRFASSCEDARVCAQALFEEKGKECDGLVVLNTTDPYDVAPLKYKDLVTCDFVLESATSGDPGTFVLLAEQQARSSGFRGSSRSSHQTWDAGAVQSRGRAQLRGHAPWGARRLQEKRGAGALSHQRITSREMGNGGNWSQRGRQHTPAGDRPSRKRRRRGVKKDAQLKQKQEGKGRGRRAQEGGGAGGSDAGWQWRPGGLQCGARVSRGRLEVVREPNGAVAYVTLGAAQRRKLGLPDVLSRSTPVVVECRKTKSAWTVVRARPDRVRPNGMAVVKKNVELNEKNCVSRPWFLRALPLQNDFHIYLRWVEACARTVVFQSARASTVVEIGGCSSVLYLYGPGQRVVCYEPDQQKRRPLEEARGRCRAKVEIRPYAFEAEEDVKPDAIHAFFTVGAHFASDASLREFVDKVRRSGATRFCGLYWSGSEPLHSPGRYSVRVEAALPSAASSSQASLLGTPMTVQFATTDVQVGYVACMLRLMEHFSDADYAHAVQEELPGAVHSNGCPVTYAPLAQRLATFNFIRA